MITWIWIISLIALVATSVFVYKMLVTSSELLSIDKRAVSKLLRTNSRDKYLRQSLETLNSRMKSLEDSNSHYVMQFTRLQHQLGDSAKQGAARAISDTTHPLTREDEDDWEEMYYLENETRVQLENELDATRQEMLLISGKHLALVANNVSLVSSNSDYEAQLAEIPSLHNQIEIIQKKLVASLNRERELDQLLQKDIHQKKEYTKIFNENTFLKNEGDDQRRQLKEMLLKEQETSKKRLDSSEMQSKIAIYQDEQNLSIRKLERIINQNKMFAD